MLKEVYGRPFDEEMDRHIQMGMYATDRIATDGTMHKVIVRHQLRPRRKVHTHRQDRALQRDRTRQREASSVSQGRRWTVVEPEPWSCDEGTPPIAHREPTVPDALRKIDDERDDGTG